MPRASLLELRCGEYFARVAPAAGARIASLEWCRGSLRRPLLVEWDGQAFDAQRWPKAGAFPMLPFANRLAPEGFGFAGRWIRPEPGPDGFAVHGFAHRNRWDVASASDDCVLMRYVCKGGDPGWPWAWSAAQEVRLSGDGMTVEMRVRNDSDEPMPLALGWHPYHPVAPDITSADLRFEAHARHGLDVHGAIEEPSNQPAFGMRRGETAAFSQWDGAARIRTAGGTIEIGGAGAANLVVHRPATGDYLCVEPVTALPGRLAQALPLEPGETRRVAWSCRWQPA